MDEIATFFAQSLACHGLVSQGPKESKYGSFDSADSIGSLPLILQIFPCSKSQIHQLLCTIAVPSDHRSRLGIVEVAPAALLHAAGPDHRVEVQGNAAARRVEEEIPVGPGMEDCPDTTCLGLPVRTAAPRV